jgi:hypothetical protein
MLLVAVIGFVAAAPAPRGSRRYLDPMPRPASRASLVIEAAETAPARHCFPARPEAPWRAALWSQQTAKINHPQIGRFGYWIMDSR